MKLRALDWNASMKAPHLERTFATLKCSRLEGRPYRRLAARARAETLPNFLTLFETQRARVMENMRTSEYCNMKKKTSSLAIMFFLMR